MAMTAVRWPAVWHAHCKSTHDAHDHLDIQLFEVAVWMNHGICAFALFPFCQVIYADDAASHSSATELEMIWTCRDVAAMRAAPVFCGSSAGQGAQAAKTLGARA